MKGKLLKTLILGLGIGTASLHAVEVDLGHPTSETPFDRYHGPVRQVFSRCGTSAVSVESVRSYLRTARRFRYYFDPGNPYQPQLPEITEAKRQGDCKAKALWLAQKMGDSKARYAVGRAKLHDRIYHAWLIWPKAGTWYALDPTMESDLLFSERIVGRKLFTLYSYNGSGAYRHSGITNYIK